MNLEIRAENFSRTEPCGMSSGIPNIWRRSEEEKTMELKLFFKLSGTSWWKTSQECKNKRLSVDSRMQEVIFRSNDSCKGKPNHCHTSSFVKLPPCSPIICTQCSGLPAATAGEPEEDILEGWREGFDLLACYNHSLRKPHILQSKAMSITQLTVPDPFHVNYLDSLTIHDASDNYKRSWSYLDRAICNLSTSNF